MKTVHSLSAPAALFVLLLCSCDPAPPAPAPQAPAAAAEPAPAPAPGLIHNVHIWLDEGLDEGQVRHFLDGVRSLEEIPSVRRLFLGGPAATPSRGVVDNSFSYAIVVWFDDVAGHDAYQEHPIHLRFVEENEAKFDRVRVRDNVVE